MNDARTMTERATEEMAEAAAAAERAAARREKPLGRASYEGRTESQQAMDGEAAPEPLNS